MKDQDPIFIRPVPKIDRVAIFKRDRFISCLQPQYCNQTPEQEIGLGVYFLTANDDGNGRPISTESLPEQRRRGAELLTSGLIRTESEDIQPVLTEVTQSVRSLRETDPLWDFGWNILKISEGIKSYEDASRIKPPMVALGEYFVNSAISDCDPTVQPPDIDSVQRLLDSYGRKLNARPPRENL